MPQPPSGPGPALAQTSPAPHAAFDPQRHVSVAGSHRSPEWQQVAPQRGPSLQPPLGRQLCSPPSPGMQHSVPTPGPQERETTLPLVQLPG
jgi:hypothetical protein